VYLEPPTSLADGAWFVVQTSIDPEPESAGNQRLVHRFAVAYTERVEDGRDPVRPLVERCDSLMEELVSGADFGGLANYGSPPIEQIRFETESQSGATWRRLRFTLVLWVSAPVAAQGA
ncbi:MAG: hypothetical protein ACK4P3_04335, partial [Fimbriimonadaceae bacterium]